MTSKTFFTFILNSPLRWKSERSRSWVNWGKLIKSIEVNWLLLPFSNGLQNRAKRDSWAYHKCFWNVNLLLQPTSPGTVSSVAFVTRVLFPLSLFTTYVNESVNKTCAIDPCITKRTRRSCKVSKRSPRRLNTCDRVNNRAIVSIQNCTTHTIEIE